MTAAGEGSTRFVGRERELEALLNAAAAAAAGRSGTVLLEGPSGVGATRLLDEAIGELARGGPPARGGLPAGPGFTILRADNLPAWRDAPYAPFLGALQRQLAGRDPAVVGRLLGTGAELLLPMLPGIAGAVPDAPPAPASRERLAERVREAVRGVLGRLAADGPVVLAIEDLHVLDAATRELVAFLARTLGERPILIVGSYQPDALRRGHPLRATLEAIASGPRPARRLALAPLDRSELQAFITAHEGEAPSAPVLLLVAERSGGSPLVAEEVLAARRELSGASLAVPLDQLVVARAALRTPECRRVLRILSTAGGPLTPTHVVAAAAAYDAEVGRPAPRSAGSRRAADDGIDADLAAGIAEAIEHRFVEAEDDQAAARPSEAARGGQAGRRAAGDVRIRHELLAGALAADLLPGPRRRMQAALASTFADRPFQAGRFWHRAHEAGHELVAEVEAAAEAERMGAAADALIHLEGAIELSGAPAAAGVITGDEELSLLVRAAEASNESGDTGRAVAFAEMALARHRTPSDRPARAALVERVGAYHWAGGDRDHAAASYEQALELLPAAPTLDRARVLALLADARVAEGQYTDGEQLAEAAVAVAEEVGSAARGWLGHARCAQGVIDGWLGRPEQGIARLEDALAIAIETDRLEDAFRARANLAVAYDLQGRRAAAVEVSLQGIEAAEAVGLEVAHGAILRGNAVDALVSLGRWAEARQMAERALEWAPSGVPFVIAALGLAVIEIETAAGDAAAALLGRLFLEIETVPYVELAAPVYQAAASFALWRGDVADASRSIDAAWGRVRASEEWALAARVAAAALAVAAARNREAQQRHDLAEIATARAWSDAILREASAMVDGSGVPGDTWVRREVGADLATAAAYAARIRGHDRPGAWADVADEWRALGRPYETARARFCQAEATLDAATQAGVRREGRDDAREPLLAALSIAVDLEAVPLLRQIVDLAERARIALPDGALTILERATPAPPVDATKAARVTRARPDPGVPGTSRGAPASFGLSPRERGVLAEIVAGRTNREIGERLFISEKTVGVHVGNILAKLGVGGRVEAAMVALRLGLVDDALVDMKKPGPGGPGFRGRRGGAGRSPGSGKGPQPGRLTR